MAGPSWAKGILLAGFVVATALASLASPAAAQAPSLQNDLMAGNAWVQVRMTDQGPDIGTWSARTTPGFPNPGTRDMPLLADAGGLLGKTSDLAIYNFDGDRIFATGPESATTGNMGQERLGSSVTANSVAMDFEVLPPTGEHLHVHQRLEVLSPDQPERPETTYVVHSFAACNEGTDIRLGFKAMYDYTFGEATVLERAWIRADATVETPSLASALVPEGAVGAVFTNEAAPFGIAHLFGKIDHLGVPVEPTPPTLGMFTDATVAQTDWAQPPVDGADTTDGVLTLYWGHSRPTAYLLKAGECAKFSTLFGLGLDAVLPPLEENLPPVPVPEVTVLTGCKDSGIELNAGGSYDPDGGIEAIEWDLGDGTRLPGTKVAYKYPKAGIVGITLFVKDDKDLWASKTLAVDQPGAANCPPSLEPVPDFLVPAGQSFRHRFVASDHEHDPLSFVLEPDPSPLGITFVGEGMTAVMDWTPTRPGTYSLVVRVHDQRSYAQEEFTVLVPGQSESQAGTHYGDVSGGNACPADFVCIGLAGSVPDRDLKAAPRVATLPAEPCVAACPADPVTAPSAAPAAGLVLHELGGTCDDGCLGTDSRPQEPVALRACRGCGTAADTSAAGMPVWLPIGFAFGATALVLTPVARWATRRGR